MSLFAGVAAAKGQFSAEVFAGAFADADGFRVGTFRRRAEDIGIIAAAESSVAGNDDQPRASFAGSAHIRAAQTFGTGGEGGGHDFQSLGVLTRFEHILAGAVDLGGSHKPHCRRQMQHGVNAADAGTKAFNIGAHSGHLRISSRADFSSAISDSSK